MICSVEGVRQSPATLGLVRNGIAPSCTPEALTEGRCWRGLVKDAVWDISALGNTWRLSRDITNSSP